MEGGVRGCMIFVKLEMQYRVLEDWELKVIEVWTKDWNGTESAIDLTLASESGRYLHLERGTTVGSDYYSIMIEVRLNLVEYARKTIGSDLKLTLNNQELGRVKQFKFLGL